MFRGEDNGMLGKWSKPARHSSNRLGYERISMPSEHQNNVTRWRWVVHMKAYTHNHAATLDEVCRTAVRVSPGKANDGAQIDTLHSELPRFNLLILNN